MVGYSNGGAGEGLTWANNVYSAVVNSNISGFVYWEGVQWPSPNTNEKLIRVDDKTGAYEVSRRLWAFANWYVLLLLSSYVMGVRLGDEEILTCP